MSQPTDADRATGLHITQTVPGGLMPDAIAQALADERDRARAPFLRLVDELAATELNLYSDGPRVRRDVAEMIREAAR